MFDSIQFNLFPLDVVTYFNFQDIDRPNVVYTTTGIKFSQHCTTFQKVTQQTTAKWSINDELASSGSVNHFEVICQSY